MQNSQKEMHQFFEELKKIIILGMVEKIRNFLYNILLNHALNAKITCIDEKNEGLLIQKTIVTLLGLEIHFEIPIEFQALFYDFGILKKSQPENFEFLLTELITKVQKRKYFNQELNKVNQFLKEANGIITKQNIQDHFYNGIADEILCNDLIPLEDIKSREPYIYLAATSLVIIKTIALSLKLDGFFLFGQKLISNERNCPEEYQPFFKMMKLIKSKFHDSNLNMDALRFYCLMNPDLESKYDKTPELMQLVAMISGIAIEVSSMYDFKLLIEHVFLIVLGQK